MSNNKHNLQVGQTLWRQHGWQLEARTVKSIGRKYFTVAEERNIKYDLETLSNVTEFQRHRLYIDNQERLDDIEMQRIVAGIRKKVNSSYTHQIGVSLENLRKIAELLEL